MNTPQSSSNPATAPSNELVTFCIVAGSSILFCSKGVFAKLAYIHGADALTVLTLRMGFALPFFVALVVFSPHESTPITIREWTKLVGLGFLGYYVSSLVNFTGLQYVSIGLERIILYTYPSLVLAISAFLLRKPVRPVVWLACLAAWAGIVIAFTGELHNPSPSGKTVLGGALIFTSALTYASFLMLSGNTLYRVGPMRFTGIVVGFSCVFMLGHYAAARPVETLIKLPPAVYGYGFILAVFGTVAPALLLSHGLKRAGAQKFAVISAIGPVATLFLAWAILGERPNAGQAIGFVLTLGGGIATSLLKDNGSSTASAATESERNLPDDT